MWSFEISIFGSGLSESEATEAQRKRADGLSEANRSKEEFMALLSHELRSPLSPIINALSILRQMRTNGRLALAAPLQSAA